MADQHQTRPGAWTGSVNIRHVGGVGPAEVHKARRAIAEVLARTQVIAQSQVPARSQAYIADVRMRVSGGAGGSGPGLVQVNLTVDGRPTRVQMPGPTVRDAITVAMARLERRLRLLAPGRSSELPTGPDPQPRRPLATTLPGRITRLKSVPLARTAPAEASAILLAMDYDAYLFTDDVFGQDAVVFRSGPSGLHLARQYTMRPPSSPAEPAIIIHPQRTPTMTPAQATSWLVRHRLPQLFFTDAESRRGFLLCRRYDAHLTLVTAGPVRP
ncbi:hypothetical protein OHB24_20615 [Kribbella sp. NBC_00482]|uniref:hypothetical protein n=1 Tax=Kribbella sp. NBC_00482 TaxID=2975968 RepID=UPI002E18AA9E